MKQILPWVFTIPLILLLVLRWIVTPAYFEEIRDVYDIIKWSLILGLVISFFVYAKLKK